MSNNRYRLSRRDVMKTFVFDLGSGLLMGGPLDAYPKAVLSALRA